MPRVTFTKDTPSELVRWWQAYAKDLAEHELGHINIARQATATVQKEFAALGSFGSREELEVAVKNTGNRVIGFYVQKEKEYDRSTGHGFRQFPLRPHSPRPPDDHAREAQNSRGKSSEEN